MTIKSSATDLMLEAANCSVGRCTIGMYGLLIWCLVGFLLSGPCWFSIGHEWGVNFSTSFIVVTRFLL